MTRADDLGPLRTLAEVMEAAGCLLDDSDSGGEKSGMRSHLRGVKHVFILRCVPNEIYRFDTTCSFLVIRFMKGKLRKIHPKSNESRVMPGLQGLDERVVKSML